MPLTLRRPTTSQQWSTRLLDGLLFLAAATALADPWKSRLAPHKWPLKLSLSLTELSLWISTKSLGRRSITLPLSPAVMTSLPLALNIIALTLSPALTDASGGC